MSFLVCPICCGYCNIIGKNLSSFNGFIFNMFKCNDCSFYFKEVIDDLNGINKYVYDENDYIGKRLKYNNPSMLQPDREYVKKLIEAYQGTKKNFLEIGPGSGVNLVYAQKMGLTCSSLDISDSNNKFYKEVLGIKNVFANFDELPDHYYDIIIMAHVIEHISKPIEFMKLVRKKLKHDGVLLISTPNNKSFFAKVMGLRHWIYLIDDHVSFFNKDNLNTLLENTGFLVTSSKVIGVNAAHSISQFFFDRKNSVDPIKPITLNNVGGGGREHIKITLKNLIDRFFSIITKFNEYGYELVFIATPRKVNE
jgi:2-polyprenyl-3-methyl-5-hydroxy-6-metoxy-1,4-benzoquinol methylase